MMDYEKFKEVLTQEIVDVLPPVFAGYSPRISTVPKVNEKKEALTLHPPQEENAFAVPTIYLDDLYRQFMEHGDFDDIVAQALGIIIRFTGFPLSGLADLDLENKTDSLIMNVVNTEKNSHLLENIPHTDFLDLSIIYRFIMCREGSGFGTIVLTNDLLEDLGISKDEVHSLAYDNTLRMFPHRITEPFEGFFMMSNVHSVGGAATMFCKECLRDLAGRIGEDFYVIPASIHEVYAMAAEQRPLRDLVCMLEEGNRLYTADSEVLSNSIYFYDIEKEKLSIAGSYVAM